MSPSRRTSLAAGLLYLVTFASSIPAVGLLAPVLDDPAYVLGAGADARVLWGTVLDLVNAAACVGTAVVLYPVLRHRSPRLALGFVASRVLEAAIIAVGVVCLIAVVSLRQDGAGAADEGALVVAAAALVAVRDATFLLGPSLVAGINAALLGTALLRSGLVPRVLPVLGLVGAPLLLATVGMRLFGLTDPMSPVVVVSVLPIFVWELGLGLWLVARGLHPTAPVADDDLELSPSAPR